MNLNVIFCFLFYEFQAEVENKWPPVLNEAFFFISLPFSACESQEVKAATQGLTSLIKIS